MDYLTESFHSLKDRGFFHALVCVKKLNNEQMQVMHICGYSTKPSEIDRAALIEELSEDKELDMVGEVYGLDYYMVEFDIMEELNNSLVV